jgi:hypothetical protein
MHRRSFFLSAAGLALAAGAAAAPAGAAPLHSAPVEMQGAGDAAQMPSRPSRRRRRGWGWRRRSWGGRRSWRRRRMMRGM